MIQRIQTLYLLLAVIAVGLTFAFDFCQYSLEGSERQFIVDLFSVQEMSEEGQGDVVGSPSYQIWLLLLLGFLELDLIGALLLFKQRKIQVKLVHLSYLLEAGTIVLLFFSMEDSVQVLPIEKGSLLTSYGLGWLMPTAALAFSFLAARGIKKDEELVRSVDRLR